MFTTIKMGSELVGRGTTEVLQSNTAEDLLTQPTKTGLAGLSNAAEPRSFRKHQPQVRGYNTEAVSSKRTIPPRGHSHSTNVVAQSSAVQSLDYFQLFSARDNKHY